MSTRAQDESYDAKFRALAAEHDARRKSVDTYFDAKFQELADERAEKRLVDQERAGPPDPLDREEAEQENGAPFCDQCDRPIIGEVWITSERHRTLCYRCWDECDETVAYRAERRWFHKTFRGR